MVTKYTRRYLSLAPCREDAAMSRPSDGAIARAFWAIFERELDYDRLHKITASAFTVMV
jgi:hypothetical protein